MKYIYFLLIILTITFILIVVNSESNNCNLYGGFIASLIGSILVALATNWIVNKKRGKQLFEKFGIPEGEYKTYSYKKNSNQLEENPNGSARIKYLGDNILEIIVKPKEHPNWIGLMTMETGYLGTISWQFTNPPDDYKGLTYGLKRCIVKRTLRNVKKTIYLIEQFNEDIGKEVLVARIKQSN